MFNNPYMTNYNPSINQQSFNERIDNEITRLQQMKEQMQKPVQQPTNLTQNFQLAPANSHTMRYANTIEDVSRENVTLTIGSIPAVSQVVPAVETVPPTIKNANLIIRKLS